MRSLANGSDHWGTALCQVAVTEVEAPHPRTSPRDLLTLYVVYDAFKGTPARRESLRVSGSLVDRSGRGGYLPLSGLLSDCVSKRRQRWGTAHLCMALGKMVGEGEDAQVVSSRVFGVLVKVGRRGKSGAMWKGV